MFQKRCRFVDAVGARLRTLIAVAQWQGCTAVRRKRFDCVAMRAWVFRIWLCKRGGRVLAKVGFTVFSIENRTAPGQRGSISIGKLPGLTLTVAWILLTIRRTAKQAFTIPEI